MRNVAQIKPHPKKPGTETLSVLIPIAGSGSKTSTYGSKSLLEYKKNTVLENQLEIVFSVYPKVDVTLVLGFDAQRIYKKISQKYPSLKYVYIPDYNLYGQAFSIISGCLSINTSNVLIVYGDIIFNRPAISKFQMDKSYLLCDSKKKILSDKVGIMSNNYRVSIIQHGIKSPKWAQIAMLAKQELDIVKGLFNFRDSYRWMGYEIFNYVMRSGGRFTSVEFPRQDVFEINTLQDLQPRK